MADKTILEAEVKSNVGEVTKDVDKLNKSTEKASGGFKGMGKAIKGIGTAIKGAGLLILAGLLAKLMDVFRSNQKVLDTFNSLMTGLSIAFNDLFRYLDDNYEVIKGYLKGLFTDPLGELAKLGMGIQKFFVEKMKGAVQVLEGAFMLMQSFANPQKFAQGLAKITAGIITSGKEISEIYTDIESNVSDYISSVSEQAKGITALEKAARAAGVEFAMLNAKFLKDAEIQRQIRDDVNKTFAERIEANEELSKILVKQQELQTQAIQKQVDSAFALHKADKTNLDNKLAYQETLVAQAELEETIKGQQSEQLTNQTTLENELRDAQQQTRLEGITGIERELKELEFSYEAKKRLAEQSGIAITAITKQYEQQKEAIVQSGVNAQLNAYSSLTGALGKLAGENKEFAIAQAVMDTYAAANSILTDPSFVGPSRFAAAAAAILTGLANVQSIMQVQVPGGGGGGGMGASAQAPAPQMMSGTFELGGGQAPEPVQAYVVSDDITSNQNKLATIRRRATI